MAKRFTDTDKWKKPFIRGLEGPYKLLWFYILDDCDHAGIWQVDFEVARIRTGEQLDKQAAINFFGERIEIFADGGKWFLRDFITFQYGELSEKNRLHISVINILKKNKIGPYKGLTSPQGQGIGQGTIQGQGTSESFEKKFKDTFDEIFIDQLKTKYRMLDMEKELNDFLFKCNAAPTEYHCRDRDGLRLGFMKQLKGEEKNQSNGKSGIAKIIEQQGKLDALVTAKYGS